MATSSAPRSGSSSSAGRRRPPHPSPPTPPSPPRNPTESKPHRTERQDKVPVWEKALYGLGNPPQGIVTNVVESMSKPVLVFGMGMSPSFISLAVMIFRIWDSFTDPFMGWISDRTRSRWGRRKPYIFMGALMMALMLPFVYRFDAAWSHWMIIGWYIGIGLLMATATTLYNIPYQSLKLEMSPDYNERTSINAYASLTSKIMGIFVVPWIWWFTQQPFVRGESVDGTPDILLGIRNVCLWLAGFILVMSIIPSLVCKERYYTQACRSRKEPFWHSLKLTVGNRPFRYIMAFILVLGIEGLIAGMGSILLVYYIHGGDQLAASKVSGVAGTVASAFGILAIPLFSWIATRYSKERSLLISVVAGFFMALGIAFFYSPENPWLVIIPMSLNGAFNVGMWLVLPSMQADVVDHDELQTGERREGSYSSVFSFLLKLSSTLMFGLSGPLVEFLGFDIALRQNQAEGVFSNIKLAMMSVPAAVALIHLWLILKYPLTPAVVADIRRQLEARRGSINPKASTPATT
jgi:glycoside/pentoside/hexuronide:cation symporter, GPH family